MSDRKKEYDKKWKEKNVDFIATRLPKGTRERLDRLIKQGKIKSYNDFILTLGLEEIERLKG